MIIDDSYQFNNNNKFGNQNQNISAMKIQNKFKIKRNYNKMISMYNNNNQCNNLNSFPEMYNKKMKLTGIEPNKNVQVNNNIVRIMKSIPEKIKREIEKYQNERILYTSKLNISPCNCNNNLQC